MALGSIMADAIGPGKAHSLKQLKVTLDIKPIIWFWFDDSEKLI